MAAVKKLKIQLVPDGNGALYASWEFDTPTSADSSGSFKVGDLVKINSTSATYYNGVEISDWVFPLEWYISKLDGSRAVLGADSNGLFNIVSPIDVKWLTKISGSAGEETDDTLDSFEVKWTYCTTGNVWFTGSSATVKGDEEWTPTYNPPNNAVGVKVSVKPIAKKFKSGNNEVEYWTGTSVMAEYDISVNPPESPPNQTVTVKGYKLTAVVDNIKDFRTDEIEFEIYDNVSPFTSGTAVVQACKATYSCDLKAGGNYRVHCRSVNRNGASTVYSDWTDFTTEYVTVPDAPTAITKCAAISETAAQLEWAECPTAETYELEYADNKLYFDNSELTTKKPGITTNRFIVSGLTAGHEYFFRLRAVNKQGESAWTKELASVVVGTTPVAPTTWSSTTTAIIGEKLTLHWVHNCEDNSAQTIAYLQFTDKDGIIQDIEILEYKPKEEEGSEETGDETTEGNTATDGGNKPEFDTSDDADGSDELEQEAYGTISTYEIDTNEYSDGSELRWKVRTAGISLKLGEFSAERVVKFYAPPTLSLSVSGGSFPINISATAGPESQRPLGFHVSIIPNSSYQTTDNIGNPKMVAAGEVIYTKYFNSTTSLDASIYPNEVDLAGGVTYRVVCTAAMDSGLSVEKEATFGMSGGSGGPEPDASVMIDTNTYTAAICPIGSGELSVYRREYNGSFTEIATNVASGTWVTDPHPALDFARYRIVSTSPSSGGVSYYDVPGQPMGCKSVIIQWDEVWSNFDVGNEDALEEPTWAGSLLRLPYNIDVSEGSDNDVSFVNYIGREHPVSYYGTQIGETATWNMAIPKSDKKTLYALRRLAKWMGDVYVREPSGIGYWAHVKVSLSQKHLDLTIPVTMDITRVEGGM